MPDKKYDQTIEKHRSKVLIVDDMPVNRTILSSMLATHGIDSDMAESGSECLELYRRGEYDLILLDHRMPEMDGVDTLLQLKNIFLKTGREIPVICHTTDDARPNINLYKAAGFADVLIKPIDPGQLAMILMTYLPEGVAYLDENEDKSAEFEDELSVLPSWVKTVPKLDIISGLKHCDTAEDYVDALNVFASSIDKKADEIEKYEKEENWAMVTLRVHSLKSMARLIGAEYLADHAADAEYAGKHENINRLINLLPDLLTEYREFKSFLMPLKNIHTTANDVPPSPPPMRYGNAVLLICQENGIVSKGIEKNLNDAGFKVIIVPDKPEHILSHRLDADMMLYYPQGDMDHIRQISSHICELATDDRKILCLTGDPLDIEEAMKVCAKNRINAIYPRPVNMDKMVTEMRAFANMQKELNRTKTVLIIDDDIDFLTIMDRWLKGKYKADCARSGIDALHYLTRTKPDLILLDYEMPDLDGYEVMRRIRHDPDTYQIPIIFLTGKNDREDVMKILERKPDGYLLKTMSKETLLDSLDRFFAGNILTTID